MPAQTGLDPGAREAGRFFRGGPALHQGLLPSKQERPEGVGRVLLAQ
jgi:hypothetical protein